MGNVLLLVVVVGLVAAVAVALLRRAQRPEARLLRDFRRLRSSILGGLDAPTRAQAKELLLRSEAHLRALMEARRQRELLQGMAQTAQEMTRAPVESGVSEAFDRQVAEQLSGFFGSLAQISATVGFRKDETLGALRRFSEDLEVQREALASLGHPSARVAALAREIDALPQGEAAPAEPARATEGAPASKGG